MRINKLLESFGGKMGERELFFEDRTKKHVDLVKKAAEKIAEAYPEYADVVNKAAKHDASKFEEPERTPYIDLTWKRFQGK